MSAFSQFLDRYGQDPVLFVREVLGVEPDPWQAEALRFLADPNEDQLAIRAGNGVGKTAFEAWGIVWTLCCVFPQHTLVTAPSQPQLFGALAKEVTIWMGRLPQSVRDIFEEKVESIHHKAKPKESLVEFRTARPETPEAMAGVHMEGTAEMPGSVFLWLDEAAGIADAVINSATGALSGARTKIIMVANPTRLAGQFYRAFHREEESWHTIHVPSSSCPRVTEKFRRKCELKGKNHYRIFYEGNFPDSEGDAVVPREWVVAALTRDVQPHWVRPIWGVDVAYKGGDRRALAKRKGNVLLEPVMAWEGLDTMESVAALVAEYEGTPDKHKPSDICIDAIGYGAGVAHRLREMGLPAREINVAETSAMKDRYPNLRCELGYAVRDWFETKAVNIANDRDLCEEVCSMERQERADRKDAIVPKRSTMSEESEYESPDLLDALMLTFAASAITAAGGISPSAFAVHKRNILGLP